MLVNLKEMVNEAQFKPTILSLFVNPFYFARKGLYQNVASLASKLNGDFLDVGCGQKPYKLLFDHKRYIGLEIDSPENRLNKKADFFYDGKVFPFGDSEFDAVIVNQVLEHVFEPEDFLSEVKRVLKQDGFLLLTVPFTWDEHEQPLDFARYTSFGLKYLLEKCGFEIIEQRKSVADIRVIFQLVSAYIYRTTFTHYSSIDLLITLFLISPINVIGECLAFILPKNEALYLDNIVLTRKRD